MGSYLAQVPVCYAWSFQLLCQISSTSTALPKLVEPEELRAQTAAVIDVLRSTTTIVHALAAAAREVIPCAEVEEARQIAGQFPADQVALGGERRRAGGARI